MRERFIKGQFTDRDDMSPNTNKLRGKEGKAEMKNITGKLKNISLTNWLLIGILISLLRLTTLSLGELSAISRQLSWIDKNLDEIDTGIRDIKIDVNKIDDRLLLHLN